MEPSQQLQIVKNHLLHARGITANELIAKGKGIRIIEQIDLAIGRVDKLNETLERGENDG